MNDFKTMQAERDFSGETADLERRIYGDIPEDRKVRGGKQVLERNCNLYVGGLGMNTDEKMLIDVFGQY